LTALKIKLIIFCNLLNQIYQTMTYAQLKAFHAVAQERSFQRAAARLRLTQPAVSIQVRNLEQASAGALFRRSGHSVALTEEGRALFAITSRLFAAEGDAQRLLSGGAAAPAPTLHLGADGPHVALDLIAAVRRLAPEIRFRVTLANAEATWESLLVLQVDAAVMAETKADPRVEGRLLATQDMLAIVPRAHPLARSRRLSLERLAEEPLVLREAGSNTQRQVDEAFAARGLSPAPAAVMGSREGVKEAVARGLGIGFLFEREAGADRRYGTAKVAGLEGSNRDLLLCLKEQRKNPLVAALFEAAESLADEASPPAG
jgi:aminoethylphosphonate catabolism LysR family transcriptional regulator